MIDDAHLKAGLAGAALLELNLQEALALDGEGKKVRLRSSGAAVDPKLVPVLARGDDLSVREGAPPDEQPLRWLGPK